MASTVAKVRFVRCAKCLKLLPEFADVPVYQCGGCGAVLRAKNHNAGGEKSLKTNPSQILSGNGSSDNISTSAGKINISSLDHGREHATCQNLCSTSSNTKNYCHDEGESSDTGANGIEERGSNNTNQLAFSTSDADGSTQPKTEYSLNEEEEKPLVLSEQGSDSLSSNVKSEASPESLSHSVASEEEMVGGSNGSRQSITLRSPTLSSSDDGPNDIVRDKYRLLSRRTFRDRWNSGSVDTKAKEGGEVLSGNNMYSQVRGTSLDSEDFHSVQSWLESEKDGPSRSLSKGSAFRDDSPKCQNGSTSTMFKNLKHDRFELLEMVEELRDQLSGLYDLREERKQKSQFRSTNHSLPLFFNHDPRAYRRPQQYHSLQMPSSHLHCHLEPNFCCNNRLCRTCAYNISCDSSEAKSSFRHIDSGLPPCRHNARRTKSHCRPVSGGAPFVICYKCFGLLQMPADFLISTRRGNKLKCGACSEVLVLSFPALAHAVPQTSTEASNSSGDPVSFPESYSTEAETVLNNSRNSSEDAEAPPLHRLMGYPSARELMY